MFGPARHATFLRSGGNVLELPRLFGHEQFATIRLCADLAQTAAANRAQLPRPLPRPASAPPADLPHEVGVGGALAPNRRAAGRRPRRLAPHAQLGA